MAEKGESAEQLNALNQNMTSIKSIIKNDLDWFADELVKRNFMVRREIQSVRGMGTAVQASMLMDRVYITINIAREQFDEFVDIFKSRGGVASDELVKKLKSCINHKSGDTSERDDVSQQSIKNVSDRIAGLKWSFQNLKMDIRECLEKNKVLVKNVADVLTTVSAEKDYQHRVFVEERVTVLFRAADVPELFGTMNFHWNYLNPNLLFCLVKSFNLSEVEGKMKIYECKLQDFMRDTPLNAFCCTETRRDLEITSKFTTMVSTFGWSATDKLEKVEKFRKEYSAEYNLQECAMRIHKIIRNCFIVTWIIPESIVPILKLRAAARCLMMKFLVTRLEIDGVCVYRVRNPQTLSTNTRPIDSTVKIYVPNRLSDGQAKSSPGEEYFFVEKLLEDFLCPVTNNLLLQPHLTSCCGNHLSPEAVTRIKGEGEVCPICKEQIWSTVLNKHFQLQVNSLRVFCRHENRGCGWQGELASYKEHVESCLLSQSPLMIQPAEHSISDSEAASGTDSAFTSSPTAPESSIMKDAAKQTAAETESKNEEMQQENQKLKSRVKELEELLLVKEKEMSERKQRRPFEDWINLSIYLCLIGVLWYSIFYFGQSRTSPGNIEIMWNSI